MLSDAISCASGGADAVYLACGATDMRKSTDELAAIVEHTFGRDPFTSAWFVFCIRERDKIKILRWDHWIPSGI